MAVLLTLPQYQLISLELPGLYLVYFFKATVF